MGAGNVNSISPASADGSGTVSTSSLHCCNLLHASEAVDLSAVEPDDSDEEPSSSDGRVSAAGSSWHRGNAYTPSPNMSSYPAGAGYSLSPAPSNYPASA